MKFNLRLSLLIGALLTVLLWLIGNALSDQYFITQWLEWMPTLIVLALLAFASIALACMRAWAHFILSACMCIVVSIWYSMYENKLFVPCGGTGELSMVAWTMSHSKKAFAKESAELIVELDADITLLSHGWFVRGEEQINEWLGDSGKKLVRFPFTVLTKVPPIEIKPLIASDSIHIVSFTFDTSETLGRNTVLWVVDFPSSLSRSRYAIAMASKRLLSEIECSTPDIVAGDFNMTTDSAAIRFLFPQLRDASHHGCGVMASYPRVFPLYMIDHTLVAESFEVATYKLLDPNHGRHRVQWIELKKTP